MNAFGVLVGMGICGSFVAALDVVLCIFVVTRASGWLRVKIGVGVW